VQQNLFKSVRIHKIFVSGTMYHAQSVKQAPVAMVIFFSYYRRTSLIIRQKSPKNKVMILFNFKILSHSNLISLHLKICFFI